MRTERMKRKLTHPQTEIIDLEIAGLRLKIEKVKNLDEYLDEITEAANENEDLIPYWSELWPSSVAMVEYLSEKKEKLSRKKILEIGCGIGLVASAMAMMSFNFLATDFQEFALELTRKNIYRNSGRELQPKKLDWRNPPLTETYDVIVASDVVYERRFFMPLLDLFRKLLKPGGSVILAEPNRSVAKPFFNILREQNYQLERTVKTVKQNGKEMEISVWEIS